MDFGQGYGYNDEIAQTYQNSLLDPPPLGTVSAPTPMLSQSSQNQNILEQARTDLQYLQQLRDFDENILNTDSKTQPLDFEVFEADNPWCLTVHLFYSEKPVEREYKYQEIRMRLKEILHAAASHPSHTFPQSCAILKDPSTLFLAEEFQQIAMGHIFQDRRYGLEALDQAIATLSQNDKLTAREKEPLILYKNYAGFFYDYKAVESLSQLNHFKGKKFRNDVEGRIKLLRILQIQGEYLKSMLPWTLSLVTAMPSVKLLTELRDRLAHLKAEKVAKLLSEDKQIGSLFQGLAMDQQKLFGKFKDIYTRHPLYEQKSGISPFKSQQKQARAEAERIWGEMQSYAVVVNPDKEEENPVEDKAWPGFQGLLNHFGTPKQASKAEVDIEALFAGSYPPNAAELRRTKGEMQTWRTLIITGVGQEADDFLKTLKEHAPAAPLPRDSLETLHKTLQETQQQKNSAFKNKNEEQGKALGEKVKALRKDIVSILMANEQQSADSKKEADGQESPASKKWGSFVSGCMQKPFDEFIQELESKRTVKQPLKVTDKSITDFHTKLVQDKKAIKVIAEASESGAQDRKSLRAARERENRLFAYQLMGYKEEEAIRLETQAQTLLNLDDLKATLKDSATKKPKKQEPGKKSITMSDKFQNFYAVIKEPIEALEEALKKSLGLDKIRPPVYSWSESINPLEQWFHTVHRIKITTQQDKNSYRTQKIQKLLNFIDVIRQNMQITTTVELEHEKDWLKQTIEGKISVIQDLLRGLNFQEPKESDGMQSPTAEQWPMPPVLLISVMCIEDAQKPVKDLKKQCDELDTKTKTIENLKNHASIDIARGEFVDKIQDIFSEIAKLPAEVFCTEMPRLPPTQLEDEKAAVLEDLEVSLRWNLAEKNKLCMWDHESKRILKTPEYLTMFLSQDRRSAVVKSSGDKAKSEFLIATFYEQLKDVMDYPELSSLQGLIKTRNRFFHPKPFKDGLFTGMNSFLKEEALQKIGDNLMVLCLNVKFVLENALVAISNPNMVKAVRPLLVSVPDKITAHVSHIMIPQSEPLVPLDKSVVPTPTNSVLPSYVAKPEYGSEDDESTEGMPPLIPVVQINQNQQAHE
jgi:hypothetical protein